MYLFSILAIDIISRFLTADSLYVGTKENDNVSTHQDPRQCFLHCQDAVEVDHKLMFILRNKAMGIFSNFVKGTGTWGWNQTKRKDMGICIGCCPNKTLDISMCLCVE